MPWLQLYLVSWWISNFRVHITHVDNTISTFFLLSPRSNATRQTNRIDMSSSLCRADSSKGQDIFPSTLLDEFLLWSPGWVWLLFKMQVKGKKYLRKISITNFSNPISNLKMTRCRRQSFSLPFFLFLFVFKESQKLLFSFLTN